MPRYEIDGPYVNEPIWKDVLACGIALVIIVYVSWLVFAWAVR